MINDGVVANECRRRDRIPSGGLEARVHPRNSGYAFFYNEIHSVSPKG